MALPGELGAAPAGRRYLRNNPLFVLKVFFRYAWRLAQIRLGPSVAGGSEITGASR